MQMALWFTPNSVGAHVGIKLPNVYKKHRRNEIYKSEGNRTFDLKNRYNHGIKPLRVMSQ